MVDHHDLPGPFSPLNHTRQQIVDSLTVEVSSGRTKMMGKRSQSTRNQKMSSGAPRGPGDKPLECVAAQHHAVAEVHVFEPVEEVVKPAARRSIAVDIRLLWRRENASLYCSYTNELPRRSASRQRYRTETGRELADSRKSIDS